MGKILCLKVVNYSKGFSPPSGVCDLHEEYSLAVQRKYVCSGSLSVFLVAFSFS